MQLADTPFVPPPKRRKGEARNARSISPPFTSARFETAL